MGENLPRRTENSISTLIDNTPLEKYNFQLQLIKSEQYSKIYSIHLGRRYDYF